AYLGVGDAPCLGLDRSGARAGRSGGRGLSRARAGPRRARGALTARQALDEDAPTSGDLAMPSEDRLTRPGALLGRELLRSARSALRDSVPAEKELATRIDAWLDAAA